MVAGPMICPTCGIAMNCHAEKLVRAAAADGDPSEGVVEELHACPRCGRGASRPAPDGR